MNIKQKVKIKIQLTYLDFFLNQIFLDQPIHSYIKGYGEIRQLTTGQGEGYTTVCLLDYAYIKNHYRLIAVDLIRQKELDAAPNAI